MKYCGKCGLKVDDNDKSCINCGEKFDSNYNSNNKKSNSLKIYHKPMKSSELNLVSDKLSFIGEMIWLLSCVIAAIMLFVFIVVEDLEFIWWLILIYILGIIISGYILRYIFRGFSLIVKHSEIAIENEQKTGL